MPLEAVQVGPSISNNNNDNNEHNENNPSQPQQCPTLAKARQPRQATVINHKSFT